MISNDKILRIKTNIIPIIIDYGKSHIIHNQTHHGFINMFEFNRYQDILTLLVKSIDQIVNTKVLNKKDFHNLLYLSNFISGTSYRKDKFISANSVREFMKKAGKYSSLISNKDGIDHLNPMELIKYIYKLKSEYPLVLNSFGNARGEIHEIMNKSNARQVFEYTLSFNNQEKTESYVNVFVRLKSCSLPLSDNLFLNYYAAQSIESNLLSLRDNMIYYLKRENIFDDKYIVIFENTMNFIKTVYNKKISCIKKKSIEYNIDDISNTIIKCPYTKENFLTPKVIFDYIKNHENIEINDITEYKNIIENVLINTGYFKLNDNDKTYYMDIFNKLLNSDSSAMLNNNANIKTSRILSLQIYTKDKEELLSMIPKNKNGCSLSLEYLDIYEKILKLLY
jgi:hypothetical protein